MPIRSVTPADLLDTLPADSPLRSVVSYCFETLHLSLGETQRVLLNANDVVNALVTIADAASGRLELDPREPSSGHDRNCMSCGGTLQQTGRTKLARSTRPTFDSYVAKPMRLLEYTCDYCGYAGWSEDRIDEPLP